MQRTCLPAGYLARIHPCMLPEMHPSLPHGPPFHCHSWQKLTKIFASTCGNSKFSCIDAQNGIVRLKVPPMTPEKTKEVIEQRLGKPIDEVFAWIDLEAPLGSASIAQVICKLPIVMSGPLRVCLNCSGNSDPQTGPRLSDLLRLVLYSTHGSMVAVALPPTWDLCQKHA